jgi:hypothetical protein
VLPTFLTDSPTGKRLLEKPKYRQEGNIRIALKEIDANMNN